MRKTLTDCKSRYESVSKPTKSRTNALRRGRRQLGRGVGKQSCG